MKRLILSTLAITSFSSCDYIKHQSEIDSQLEQIAIDAAKGAEKAESSSLEEDVAERRAERESRVSPIPQSSPKVK